MVEKVDGLYHRSFKVVKLVHRLQQRSPRMVELEVGLHHGYPGSDYRTPRVVKLVMELEVGLHHGSPRVVKLAKAHFSICIL